MKRVSSRLGAIKPSATMAITTKAKTMRAEGIDVIGFAAGEPDFPSPDHVVQAAIEAVQDARNHKYSAAAGLPELRGAVAVATERNSGVPGSAENAEARIDSAYEPARTSSRRYSD